MKYLEKFFNYLNESSEDITDLTKEELDDLLLPMTDLGIEYSFSNPITITSGEFSGHKSMSINFRNSFQMYDGKIVDPKFWEFLDELISLKNRLNSSNVSVNNNWQNIIRVTFVKKEKVEGDIFLFEQLYNEMRNRSLSSKSDFSNLMSFNLNKEDLKIIVTCEDYTDRKWNGLFRGIDFSKFNVDKKFIEKNLPSKSNPRFVTSASLLNNIATITITLKSES